MAKTASVYFNVAIEEMRGKLAKKQTDIRYSGQKNGETPYNLPIGKHGSTNFDNYIVLSKRRGKNMFYVKTATSVGVSTTTKTMQAINGFAYSFASYVNGVAKSDNQLRELIASYEKWRNENETLREYITRVILFSINRSDEYISYPDGGGSIRIINLCKNPIYSANVQLTSPTDSLVINYVFNQISGQRVVQKFLSGFNNVWRVQEYSIEVVTPLQRHIQMKLYAEDFTNLTFGAIQNTTQGMCYAIKTSDVVGEDNITSITIYDGKGNVVVSGQPYRNEVRTEELSSNDQILETEILYF